MNRFERNPIKTSIILFFIFLIIMIAISETTLSWLARQKNPDLAEKPVERFLTIREWSPNYEFRYAPTETRVVNSGGIVDEEYVIRTDKEGFIEPSVVHEVADMEIVFLGGSTTECLYVREENRFPYLTGRRLEDLTGLKINSINAGKSGNTSMNSMINFVGKVAPRRPDYAVMMHASNDLGVLGGGNGYWNNSSDHKLVWQSRTGVEQGFKMIRDSLFPRTYQIIKKGIKSSKLFLREAFSSSAQAATVFATDKEKMRLLKGYGEAFESSLRSFVRTAKAWDVQPVLMTQVLDLNRNVGDGLEGAYLSAEALQEGGFAPDQFDHAHDYFNAIVVHVAGSEGADLIDLANAAEWQDEDLYDGFHFTDTGSIKVADILSKEMKRIIDSHQ